MPVSELSEDSRDPAQSMAAGEPAATERVYTLGELIPRKILAQLRTSSSKLCNSELAICDAAGRRIDASPADAPAGCDPCELAGQFSVPVTWKDHTLGRVVILDRDPDERTRELAALIADNISALCHAQGNIRKRVAELATLYDLSGMFALSQDLETLLNIAAKRICDVMNVKAASIRLLDEATGELIITGEHNLSERYLRKGRITLQENPLDAAAFSGQIVYIEDARTDPRVRYPEHARSEGIVSGLCCPMSYRGYNVGVLRVYSGVRQEFSTFEVELLRVVASQAAAAIVHSRLFEESVEAAKHSHQMRHAGQIQRRMIPNEPPHHGSICFGHVYEPSLDVGGDFFDFLDLPEGNVGVAIADVAGKGMPGALLMASVRSALRAHARSIFDINEIVGQVNRDMCRDTQVSEFATLFYGVFSPDGSRLTYCNAGHNPPLLLRGDVFTPLETGGGVIGVFPDEAFEKQVVGLLRDDLLVFYTDGVTEAFDYDDNFYGLDRLKNSILRHRREAVQTHARELLWDVRRFAGLVRQNDDISLVVARVEK